MRYTLNIYQHKLNYQCLLITHDLCNTTHTPPLPQFVNSLLYPEPINSFQ